MSSITDGAGQEETTNSIAIYLSKRTRKYLRMVHGQCCNDNCGCCPRLQPPSVPGPNDELYMNLNTINQLYCINCITE